MLEDIYFLYMVLEMNVFNRYFLQEKDVPTEISLG